MNHEINGTEDVRGYIMRACENKRISGYALEQGMTNKGLSNASGCRHFLSGRQANITLDTFFTMCKFLKLRVTIEETGRKGKKKESRPAWDWKSHSPAYKHLVNQGGEA